MGHDLSFTFAGQRLTALPSGALWWQGAALLVVSDLHLGKSERMARNGGALLPPYETLDTLTRLDADIAAADPAAVICLGDSFDDMGAAEALEPAFRDWILRLMAGRDWTWITGNHDPAPTGLGGHAADGVTCGPLTFRHIATDDVAYEVSGHYHPKAALSVKGRRISRPCFLRDARRLILPAYGTYTGGLRSGDRALTDLMAADARAILAGRPMVEIPMPR
ncbi:MAG: ligase-associated DNA damage response endonuclease PdeM [Pseudomonadota bacterium]